MPLPTPSFKFESGYMYLVSPILFSFTTLLTKSGKREFCFSFIADVHAQGYLWIEQNPMRLRSNLTLLGATDVREQGSIAGPIELKYAAQLLQVLRGPGEHALNTGPVGQAIPLSSNSTFSLKNTEVNISKDGLFSSPTWRCVLVRRYTSCSRGSSRRRRAINERIFQKDWTDRDAPRKKNLVTKITSVVGIIPAGPFSRFGRSPRVKDARLLNFPARLKLRWALRYHLEDSATGCSIWIIAGSERP